MTGLFGSSAPSAAAVGTFSRLDFQSRQTEAAPDEAAKRNAARSVLPKGAWPIRDQRYRNTCVPFAACAALEAYRAASAGQDAPEALSEDFLYNRMRNGLPQDVIDKIRHVLPDYELGATLLEQAMLVQRDIGSISEEARPYQQTTPLFDIDGTNPSDKQKQDAAAMKHAGFYYHKVTVDADNNIDPDQTFPKPGATGKRVTASDAAWMLLDAGSPVAVGLPVYQLPDARMNWTSPASVRSGFVPYPGTDTVYDAALVVASGHAVCITGYVPVTDAPGGGYFVFRNSWGLDFRTTSHDPAAGVAGALVPPGYGVLSAASVDRYVWEMMAPIASA